MKEFSTPIKVSAQGRDPENADPESTVIVDVKGKVDSSNAYILDLELLDLISQGYFNLSLDFRGIDYLSSAGLRTLVACKIECIENDGDLKIENPSDRSRETFVLAGLDELFNISDPKK